MIYQATLLSFTAFFLFACTTSAQQLRSRNTQNFDWAITLDHIVVDFGAATDNSFTVTFQHDNVSGADVTAHIMDPSCNDYYYDNVGGLSAQSVAVDATTAIGKVAVDFGVLGDLTHPFWTPPSESSSAVEGEIKFCYRVNVAVDGTIINFVNTVISAQVNMLSTFKSNDSDVDGSLFLEEEALVIMAEFPLTIFVCDDNAVAIANPEAIAPGGILHVCLTDDDPNSDLQVESIYSATLSQQQEVGALHLASIVQGIEQNSFTATDCTTFPGICRFTTVLEENVWFDANQGELTITGTSTMGLKQGDGRREEEAAERPLGGFSLNVEIADAASTSTAAISSSYYTATASRCVTALSMLSVVALLL